MLRYALRRFGSAVLLTIFVSLVAFLLVFASGDPAVRIAGEAGTAADAARVRAEFGFDQPIWLQYLRWLAALLRGDLGHSFYFNQPVAVILRQPLETTLQLGLCAIVFALVLAVPLGVAAGRWPNSWIDRGAMLFAVIGQAVPSFVLALLLIIVFSIHARWLPPSGFGSWRQLVMPTVVLGYFGAPTLMRLTRSGVIAVLETDHIRTSRAMGIPARRILLRYTLRNAAIPVVAVASAQFGYMLAGSVVVESVFAIPGAGQLAWQSILRSDLPTVQALVLCFACIYVLLTLAADLASAWLDPRMRA